VGEGSNENKLISGGGIQTLMVDICGMVLFSQYRCLCHTEYLSTDPTEAGSLLATPRPFFPQQFDLHDFHYISTRGSFMHIDTI
jgi:hypothetical protein